MKDLNGKRVLITGGGGGLGRELSLAFADVGTDVIVTDIDDHGVVETVLAIRNSGGSALGFTMDVTSVDDVRSVRDKLRVRRLPIDILINNAGIVCGGAFLDVQLEHHQAVMEVNAMGPMNVTYLFLPELIARAEAHLVMIASASGLIPTPLQLSYTSSKWAALGFADALRQELRLTGQQHVHVTSVCPSYLDTAMFQGARIPRLSRTLPSAELAAKIVKAVRTGKNYVLAPWIVRIAPLGKDLLPLWMGEKLCDWLGVTDGMREWVGHDQALSSAPCSRYACEEPRMRRQAVEREEPIHS